MKQVFQRSQMQPTLRARMGETFSGEKEPLPCRVLRSNICGLSVYYDRSNGKHNVELRPE